MRHLATLLCAISFYLYSFTQAPPKVQLKTIIAEASNDFQKFRGELKTALSNDSTYISTVTLEGSKDNEIGMLPDKLIQYYAYAADSANKKEAKKLTEQWKEKITIATPAYIWETVDFTVQKRRTAGYRFTRIIDKVVYYVSVLYSKREIDNYYWVLLTISKQWKGALENEAY